MDGLKVFFLGKEQPYWEILKTRFKKGSPTRTFTFKSYFPEKDGHFQMAILQIQEFDPDILFLDYSSAPVKMLTVSRILQRCLIGFKAIIGLWDDNSEKNLVDESNTTGIVINHIKSPELGEVIFQALTLASDSPLEKNQYATIEYKNDHHMKFSHLMKIGYVTKDYMHVEHAVQLPSIGTAFELNTPWGQQFSIGNYELLRRINQNFYYSYPYNSDIKFNYQTEIGPAPYHLKREEQIKKWEEEQLLKKQEQIKEKKESAEKWIQCNNTKNKPKRTRVLIADENLSILAQADRPLDEYPFSIRLYNTLQTNENLIHKIRPGIVIVQIPKDGNQEELNYLFGLLKNESGLKPFVIIFNSTYTTQELREHFKHEQLLADSAEFDLKKMLTLCESYERNQGRNKSHDPNMSFGAQESRFYPVKEDPLSNAHFQFDCRIIKMNEAFISFESPLELSIYSVYSIKSPVEMSITIMGEEKGYGEICYWAVIHSVGERQRASLRKYINKELKTKERNN